MKKIQGTLTKFRTYEEQFELLDAGANYETQFEMRYFTVENNDIVAGEEMIGVARMNDGEEFAVNGIIGKVDGKEFFECFLVNEKDCYAMTFLNTEDNNTIIRKMDFLQGKDVLASQKFYCFGKVNINDEKNENLDELIAQYENIKDRSDKLFDDFTAFILTREDNLNNFNRQYLQLINDETIKMYVTPDKYGLANVVEMYNLVYGIIFKFYSQILDNLTQTEDGGLTFDESIKFEVEKTIDEENAKYLEGADHFQKEFCKIYTIHAIQEYFKDEISNIGLILADYMVGDDKFYNMCYEEYEAMLLQGIFESIREEDNHSANLNDRVNEWLHGAENIFAGDANNVELMRNEMSKVCKNENQEKDFLYVLTIIDLIAEKRNQNAKELVADLIDILSDEKKEEKNDSDASSLAEDINLGSLFVN